MAVDWDDLEAVFAHLKDDPMDSHRWLVFADVLEELGYHENAARKRLAAEYIRRLKAGDASAVYDWSVSDHRFHEDVWYFEILRKSNLPPHVWITLQQEFCRSGPEFFKMDCYHIPENSDDLELMSSVGRNPGDWVARPEIDGYCLVAFRRIDRRIALQWFNSPFSDGDIHRLSQMVGNTEQVS